jgi:hypothetical protein
MKPVWRAPLRAGAKVVSARAPSASSSATCDKASLGARGSSTCMTLRGEMAKGR